MKYKRKTFIDGKFQKELIKLGEKDRAYIEGEIPKTGRSIKNYSVQLFPDIDSNKLVSDLVNQDYLDISKAKILKVFDHMFK